MGLYHILNDAAVVTLPPLLPLMREDIEQLESYSNVGLLVGLGLAVTMVGQYLVGRTADRLDPRRLLPGGLALLGLSLLLLTLAGTFVQVLAVVLLLRIGGSFYHPVGISWLGRRFRGRRLDRAMGLQSACGDIGVFSGVLVAGLVGASLGWRVPLLVWGLINLAGVAVGLTLTLRVTRLKRSLSPVPPDPGPAGGRGDVRGGEPDDRRKGWRARAHGRESRTPPASPLELVRLVRPDLVSLAIGGASFGILMTYVPFLAVDELGVVPEEQIWAIPALLAFWIGMGTLAAMSYHRALRQVSRTRLLAAAFAATGLSGIPLWLAPSSDSDNLAWTLVVGGLALSGLGLFITYPIQFALISGKAGTGTHGATFGLVFAFQVGGSALIVFLAGRLADAADSVRHVFLLLLALCALATVNTLLWVREGPDDGEGDEEDHEHDHELIEDIVPAV